MKNYFAPYTGRKPALVSIKGHDVLILSNSPEFFEGGLDVFGADRVIKVKAGRSDEDERVVLSGMAQKIGAGVVVVPADVEARDVLRSLEAELFWIQ